MTDATFRRIACLGVALAVQSSCGDDVGGSAQGDSTTEAATSAAETMNATSAEASAEGASSGGSSDGGSSNGSTDADSSSGSTDGGAVCGDGLQEGSEQCDNGTDNGNGTSSCTASCTNNLCGDGYEYTATEECDLGDDNGPLPATCTDACNEPHLLLQLAGGGRHTCALADTGAVKCWGQGFFGQLGYGNKDNIGDDETPAAAGDVEVGGVVVELAAGVDHTCARLDTGAVRCWGRAHNPFAIGPGCCWGLGYGNTNDIGDDETPASAGDVDVGGTAVELVAGGHHTCARLDTGVVRCWGMGSFGQLGYGNTNNIGDDETPAFVGDVDIEGVAAEIVAGSDHTCARLDNGAVRCWGRGDTGALGHGDTNNIGDDETPVSAGDVDVGGTVVQLAAGGAHTCARLDDGAVRCWGTGSAGELGHGNTNVIGDDEAPASVGDVDVGDPVLEIASGYSHTCARLDTGAVRCWGWGDYGALGYGSTSNVGDDETPASAGDVNVGGTVVELAPGNFHTCVRLDTGAARCWGWNSEGQLGYGNADNIGDDEAPAVAGDVTLF